MFDSLCFPNKFSLLSTTKLVLFSDVYKKQTYLDLDVDLFQIMFDYLAGNHSMK